MRARRPISSWRNGRIMTGPWNNYGDIDNTPAQLGIPGTFEPPRPLAETAQFSKGDDCATIKDGVTDRIPRKGVERLLELTKHCPSEERNELLEYIKCLEHREDLLLENLGRPHGAEQE